MSNDSERQPSKLTHLFEGQSAGQKALPAETIQILADEVVVRLASRLRGTEPRLDVSIDAFCAALLSDEGGDAQKIINQERRDGVPLDTVYLHTLAGAARQLGQMWEDDRVSFLSLTVAMGRIFEILRGLRQETPLAPVDPRRPKRAFFASVPGEVHTLGVTIATSVLRNHGWEIELRTGLEHEALVEAISADDQDLIGLSAGRPEAVVPLLRLIVALNIVKPNAQIVVCGQIAEAVPGLAEIVNVDAVIGSDQDAFAVMETFVKA